MQKNELYISETRTHHFRTIAPSRAYEMHVNKQAKKGIIVLDSDNETSSQMSELLASHGYPVAAAMQLSSLVNLIESNQYLAVIIDIDSVSVKNRTIRDLALKYPGFCLLCTSKDRFHPELQDAICYHIYACLNKPIDPDELLYWIKSIYAEQDMLET